MKFGLQGINVLMQTLGNPQLRFPCIHIAGTNGKGSTASMLAAIFAAAGYKTGLYTSPHLVDYRERMRINGVPISRRAVVQLSAMLKAEIRKNRITFFEATTAIAFQYFADTNVDLAIVETGLGGRLDATNIVQPITTVITGVGLEHTELLGRTISQIAKEKAGIIKKGVACVSGVESREAESVIRKTCRTKNAVFVSYRTAKTTVKRADFEGLLIDMKTPKLKLSDLKISLTGALQAKNVAVALLALQETCMRTSFRISEERIRLGLSRIQEFSGIEGRLSVLRKRPFVIADTAHNPQAMAALTKSLKGLGINKLDLVFGVARDKDYVSMIGFLRGITRRAFVVKAKTDRALDGAELEKEFRRKRVPTELVGTVDRGVRRALEAAGNDTPIAITGSNFVVGEALAFLQGRKYLTINQ